MTLLSHPSDEQLSAFFDRHLPHGELTEIESHLSRCTDCADVVSDLAAMEQWGPAVEESLPSDLYWQDLPERVLARIAREEQTVAVPPASGAEPSWWRRLLSPGPTWAWLGATAAVAVIGGGLYLRDDGARDTAAVVDPAAPGTVSSPTEDLPEGVPPLFTASMGEEEYRSRIATTLGMNGDYGAPLDVVPVVRSGLGSPVTQVGLASPVPAGALREQDLLGSPELSYYFNSARQAEEVGRSDLAQQGYQILYAKSEPGHLARLAAETGLVRCAWRSQLAKAEAESSRTLDAMFAEGDSLFRRHLAGDHTDCRKGWETLVAFVDLAGDCASAPVIQEAKRRIVEMEPCIH